MTGQPDGGLARAGRWLAAASLLFWVAWLLMPGVGVTDAVEIFRRVGASRASVFASVVAQLLSAAAYAPGCVGLLAALGTRAPARVRAGCALLLAGAMGSAADAVLHLAAYEMTAPGAAPDAMEPVMRRLQGPGLALLLPLVASFFAGHGVLLSGLRRAGLVGPAPLRLFLAAPLALAAGALAGRLAGDPGRIGGLALLGAVAGSLASAGLSLHRADGR